MEEQSLSTASVVLLAVAGLVSFGILLHLFQRHIAGQTLLEYEPRRRVPWGAGIATIALIFPLSGIAVTLANPASPIDNAPLVETRTSEIVQEIVDKAPEEAGKSPEQFVVQVWTMFGLMVTFVVIIAALLHVMYNADWHDLGLPSSQTQLLSDIGIGLIACLVSIMPVYLIQIVLALLLQPEQGHPLVEELQQKYNTATMIASFAVVVIGAPLFEEFSFRLLVQGWLEKKEDEFIDYTPTVRRNVSTLELPGDELLSETIPAEDTQAFDETNTITSPRLSPRGFLPDLPQGWLPVLVTGTIFGLAHLGHGVSPIPLVLFGIVLGYLYQRTHRLVPSITAHAVFNAYSMTMIWLSL